MGGREVMGFRSFAHVQIHLGVDIGAGGLDCREFIHAVSVRAMWVDAGGSREEVSRRTPVWIRESADWRSARSQSMWDLCTTSAPTPKPDNRVWEESQNCLEEGVEVDVCASGSSEMTVG